MEIVSLLILVSFLICILGVRVFFRSDVKLKQSDKAATIRKGVKILSIFALILFILAWVTYRVFSFRTGITSDLRIFYIFFGGAVIVQMSIVALYRPFKKPKDDEDRQFKIEIIVPVFNEDPTSLDECLGSMLNQTRKPAGVHVVDDGSNVSYSSVKRKYSKLFTKAGIDFSFSKQRNAGKRVAHANAIRHIKGTKNNMIIVTIDSDSSIDKRALEEGVLPFYDERVTSVAGVVVAKNSTQNILSRITDVLFVAGQQLVDRTSMSVFNSVLVNSGGLALYRYDIVKKAIDYGYTSEEFSGKRVSFSDDSYLTLFSLLHGKAVQQQTAIVFADMPVKINHHIRQQLRWGRGSFIRGLWRIKYLPILSFAFFRQVIGWLTFVFVLFVFIRVIALLIGGNLWVVPFMLILTSMFSYLVNLQYLLIKRSDVSLRSQMYSYLLSPLVAFWQIFVIRTIRLYSMVTCSNIKWGTRQKVEIVHNK